ncbi:protein piccolo-like [Limulus polyphemus]|uniref:Protein piccolo-like n=1 Tax=Limulus polyphemus TaxID=6850 RepID=A0ABM1TRY5_LIMPO|nr:protein piccolo-like [Limulus polyphemus]
MSPSGKKIFIGETRIFLRQADLRDSPEWYNLNYHQVAPDNRRKTCDTLAHDKTHKKRSRQHITRGSHSYLVLHPSSASYQTQPLDDAKNITSSPITSHDDFKQEHSRKKSSSLHAQDGRSDVCSNAKRNPRVKSASFRIHRSPDIDGEREKSPESGILDKTAKKNLTRTLSLRTNRTKKHVGLAMASALSKPDVTSENEVPIMTFGPNGIRRGPGQVFFGKINISGAATLGDIKLGFLMTKGQLEVRVICARQLKLNAAGQPPDTYVKTYLKEGERQMQKRKTRVVRHSSEPQYRQTLKYNASSIQGRHLLVMVWERQKGFEHNQPLGGADIQLDRLDFSRLLICWYPIYPVSHVDLESNQSA